MQALQAATIDPAQHLGMARDLGSIETGKLADLLIVDGNPLEDIRVTDDIAYVVLNGRIYEGGTLAGAASRVSASCNRSIGSRSGFMTDGRRNRRERCPGKSRGSPTLHYLAHIAMRAKMQPSVRETNQPDRLTVRPAT